jgi:hypothetical protein
VSSESQVFCTGKPKTCQLCSIVGNVFAQYPSEVDPGCVRQMPGNDRLLTPAFDKPGPNEVFRNGAGKPVVALDIDGSLGDYHGHFLDFAEKYFGEPFPAPEEINPGLKLWQHMGIELREYRDAKLAYRQGGWKRWMPVFDGAAALAKTLRIYGAEVWICTTRPYLRLDNIDPDTREWLRRNNIEYDAVLFGDEKYHELVRQVGRSRIIGVLDDLPECLSEANQCGINSIWMMDRPYNKHFKPKWADRIDNLWDLRDALMEAIEDYKGITA